MQQALEIGRHGQAVQWINDETGNTGAVIPQRTFVTSGGVFCRDYAEDLHIFGKQATIENTACRDDDGTWTWVG